MGRLGSASCNVHFIYCPDQPGRNQMYQSLKSTYMLRSYCPNCILCLKPFDDFFFTIHANHLPRKWILHTLLCNSNLVHLLTYLLTYLVIWLLNTMMPKPFWKKLKSLTEFLILLLNFDEKKSLRKKTSWNRMSKITDSTL